MFRRAILPATTRRTFLTAVFESSTTSPSKSISSSSAIRRYSRIYSPLYTPTITTATTTTSTTTGRRLYSTEPGKEDGDKAGENGGEKESEGTKQGGSGDPAKNLLEEMNKCKVDLEAKVKEVADLKDKFLRSVADFRNLQDRTEREIRSAKDFAISKFARDLVETVDNIDLALNAVPEPSRTSTSPEKKDLVDLYNGLKMTEGALLNTLKRHGLEKVSPIGEKFDPNLHEATFQAKVEGKEPGTVFHVMRTGFSLNGRVVRAAQVGVVQAS